MFSVDNLDLDFDESDEDFLQNSFELSANDCEEKEDESPVFRVPVSINATKSMISPPGTKRKSDDFCKSPSNCPSEKLLRPALQRKFPGPAGLLPDKPPRSFNDSSLTLDEAEDSTSEKQTEPLLSQTSESVFSEPPFLKLRHDFLLTNTDSPLKTYTVDWVKKKAIGKNLKGRKIPFLAVVLLAVDCSSADPVVTLRDPTGELSGALHRDVWQEMGNKLKSGTAIALKQISVLSTGASRRHVLLNITMNNIITLYIPAEQGQVTVSSVHPTSPSYLAKTVAEWQARELMSPARNSDIIGRGTTLPQNGLGLFETIAARRQELSSTPVREGHQRIPGRAPLPEKKINATNQNTHSNSNSVRDIDHCNFDLLLDDNDFDLSNEEPFEANNVTKPAEPSLRPTSFTMSSTSFQLNNATRLSDNVIKKLPSVNENLLSQKPLSQAECLDVNEVLSGVDLGDFD